MLRAAASVAAGTALSATGLLAQAPPASPADAPKPATPPKKGRLHQSVCRWCYQKMSLEDLCTTGQSLGLQGIDLLEVNEYEVPARYGLRCTMGYVGAGDIKNALNRLENHDMIEAAFRKNIPIAAKANVPNVITFFGNRMGMSDEEGAKNCIIGLNRVKSIAEDHGVTICVELLNSKVNHKDYMGDHTAFGVQVMQGVNSPHVKLLYDIYHMQIMEGDLIDTIRQNIQYLGHFHTGGVPGRHELNDQQEVQWDAVARAIADTGYQGYFAHEFLPTGDPVAGLKQAVDRCTV
jgi:hydroxypyruvate isomerase